MKLIDRYIFRQVLTAFLFGIFAFCILFVLIDLVENLDDFIDAGVPVSTMIEFYRSFLPEIIYLMIPVAMLLASLFITGRLGSQNELATIKASGISLYRLMIPYLLIGACATGFSMYLSGWLIPSSIHTKLTIDRKYLRRNITYIENQNILFQDAQNRIVHISRYDIDARAAYRVSIQEFADTNLTVLHRRWDAAAMEWSREGDGKGSEGEWVLKNFDYRDFSGPRETLHHASSEPLADIVPDFAIMPIDIEKKQKKPDEMNFHELATFIENQKKAGQDVARWTVDFHSKIAFPFASLIVVFFGVPFATHQRKRGAALEFGVSVAVTFIYLAFSEVSKVYGYNGDLHPILTAWLANIVFLIAGCVNLLRAEK